MVGATCINKGSTCLQRTSEPPGVLVGVLACEFLVFYCVINNARVEESSVTSVCNPV